MTSSEFSVEGTASVKDGELDAGALAAAARAICINHGVDPDIEGPGQRHAVEVDGVTTIVTDHIGPLWRMWLDDAKVAIRAYLAAAPSKDQVSMGAMTEPVAWRWRLTKEAAGLHRDSLVTPPWRYTEDGFFGDGSTAREIEPLYATPPIAGAGEELIRRLWPNGLGPQSFAEIAVFVEEERKCEEEIRAQLYSRIGELSRSAGEWEDLHRELFNAVMACTDPEDRICGLHPGPERDELEAVVARQKTVHDANGPYASDISTRRTRSFHSPKESGAGNGG